MKKDSPWAKGGFTNLIRYKATGMYYIRAKVAGKVIFDSLETTNQTFAKERLDERLKQERAAARERESDQDRSEWTVAQFVDEYSKGLEVAELRPATKKYKGELLNIIGRASFIEKKASAVRKQDCIDWSHNGVSKYAPSRFNGLVDTLRAVFDLAITCEARFDNPALKIKKKAVRTKEVEVLNKEQFQKLLDALDTRKKGQRLGKLRLLVRFLAYSGMRINEAQQVTWAMVDRQNGWFRLPGSITKNHEPRKVPIMAQMGAVLDELKKYGGDLVLPITHGNKVLSITRKQLGLPKVSHHTFRHMFTTYCLMQGVPVSTVAKWRGDSDGGAMMLKVYSHLIDSHSKEMAERVRF